MSNLRNIFAHRGRSTISRPLPRALRGARCLGCGARSWTIPSAARSPRRSSQVGRSQHRWRRCSACRRPPCRVSLPLMWQRVRNRAARQRQPTPESPQRIVTACTTHDAYGAEMRELQADAGSGRGAAAGLSAAFVRVWHGSLSIATQPEDDGRASHVSRGRTPPCRRLDLSSSSS